MRYQEILQQAIHNWRLSWVQWQSFLKSFGKNINSEQKLGIIRHVLVFLFFCTRVLMKKSTPWVDRIHEFLVCDFSSKQVDRLQLHSIFRDTSAESLLLDKVREQSPLKVYFTFTKTTGQSLFNYGKFLKTLRIDVVKDILETGCACSSSPFFYMVLVDT